VRLFLILVGAGVTLVCFLGLLSVMASRQFKAQFATNAIRGIRRTAPLAAETITEQDLEHLPLPVQKYLQRSGVVGMPRVKNVKAVFSMKMRSPKSQWFTLQATQFCFFDQYQRHFYMDATLQGLTAKGYHSYHDHTACMQVKLLGFIPIITVENDTLFKAETVTLLNDMCLLAPATLISSDIRWSTIDTSTVQAEFTNGTCTVTATLKFNAKGDLENFYSDDRFDITTKTTHRFSTPVENYQKMGARRLVKNAQARWHYPDGEFTYAQLTLDSIAYNVNSYP